MTDACRPDEGMLKPYPMSLEVRMGHMNGMWSLIERSIDSSGVAVADLVGIVGGTTYWPLAGGPGRAGVGPVLTNFLHFAREVHSISPEEEGEIASDIDLADDFIDWLVTKWDVLSQGEYGDTIHCKSCGATAALLNRCSPPHDTHPRASNFSWYFVAYWDGEWFVYAGEDPSMLSDGASKAVKALTVGSAASRHDWHVSPESIHATLAEWAAGR